MKEYVINLPIFKVGDDLAAALENNENDPAKAFNEMAKRYEECFAIYQELTRIANSYPGKIKVEHADTHHISISGPKKLLQRLIDDGSIEIEK